MRDEALAGTSLLSSIYELEGSGTAKASTEVWHAAVHANAGAEGGVWTAIIQLWFGFIVCVALIMAIIYVSRCILGPDKFATQEERERAELLEALNRTESFKGIEGLGGSSLAGGPGGLWSGRSSVRSADAQVDRSQPLATPERTSPRTAPGGAADAIKDLQKLKKEPQVLKAAPPSAPTAEPAAPAPAPAPAPAAAPAPAPASQAQTQPPTQARSPASVAASAPSPDAAPVPAAALASKAASPAESEKLSPSSVEGGTSDEIASTMTQITKAGSAAGPAAGAADSAVAPHASCEAVNAQGSKRTAGVSFGQSEEHHHAVGDDDDEDAEELPTPKSNVRWMNKSLARTKSTISVRDDPDEDLDELWPPWSQEALVQVLDKTDVPAIAWPQESFDTFVEELKGGLSRMRTRDGHPMRDVDLLLLIVEHGSQVLQEQPTKDDDNRFPPMPEKVIATRMKVDEDMVDARKRLLKKAGIPEAAVMMHDNLLDVTDTVENMDLFPGLGSRVRKFLAHCEVATSDPKLLRTLGAPNGSMRVKGSGSSIKTYKWVSKESCIGLLKYFQRASAAKKRATYLAGRGHASMYWTVDGEAEVMLPWTAEAFEELCQKHGVESVQKEFGFPLNHIVAELNGGYSFLTLAKGSEPSKLMICRDIVSLLLDNGEDAAAVVAATGQNDADDDEVEAALPCQLRLADESCAATARHLAKKSLGMSASELLLSETALEQVDVTDFQRGKYDVQAWSDADRPPNRRLRHFIVHGMHSNEVVAKATTMRIARERTASAGKT